MQAIEELDPGKVAGNPNADNTYQKAGQAGQHKRLVDARHATEYGFEVH